MAYSTPEDLLAQAGEQTLLELTDDTGSGEVDQAKVARAIADADAQIDAWLGMRYQVPLADVPTVIRKLSVDLALYELFARRDVIPDERMEQRKQAVAFLRLASEGRVSLGQEDPDDTPAQAERPVMVCQERIFNRESLRDW